MLLFFSYFWGVSGNNKKEKKRKKKKKKEEEEEEEEEEYYEAITWPKSAGRDNVRVIYPTAYRGAPPSFVCLLDG